MITIDRITATYVKCPSCGYVFNSGNGLYCGTVPTGYIRDSQTFWIRTKYFSQIIGFTEWQYVESEFVGTINSSLTLEISYLDGTLLSKLDLTSGTADGLYGSIYVFPDNAPLGTYKFHVKLYDVTLREYLIRRPTWYGSIGRTVYYNHVNAGEADGYIQLSPIPE